MHALQIHTPPLAALALIVLAALLTGCSAASKAKPGAAVEVVTTVAPITSIAAAIGGDRVNVSGVIPEGTNSHTYEPKPSVAETLAQADVLYVNGLGLDDPTVKMAREVMPGGSEVVALGDRALPRSQWIYDFSFPRSGGKPNPHLWTDPRLAVKYAAVIRDDLSKRDPAGRTTYEANYRSFESSAARLDRAMRKSFATVPAKNRKLLTYHDGYAYFARDYGWKVIGAIQASDFEDPTGREVASLVDQIRAEKVPAIFGSEVFPSPVLAEISSETGVRYVDQLRDDDLPGEPGSANHSWLGLMRADFEIMTRAMGGDASALSRLSVGKPTGSRARYPQ